METHCNRLFVPDIFVTVLILPMRNGNLLLQALQQLLYPVLILPMRNGNSFLNCSKACSGGKVLILPMRNGNVSGTILHLYIMPCSYPTYEEWKLISEWKDIVFDIKCSYPTYEEWKLDNCIK